MLFEAVHPLKRSLLRHTIAQTRTGTTTVTDPKPVKATKKNTNMKFKFPMTTICYVTLENFNLSHVPVYHVADQLSMYSNYMSVVGNREIVPRLSM